MIKENLEVVENNIRKACDRAGRDYDSVTLICVSKTKPVEMIEEAVECGKREFGENKAQEVLRRRKHCSQGTVYSARPTEKPCLCEPRYLCPIAPGLRCMPLLVR